MQNGIQFPQLISLKLKKNIQQVGLEFKIFIQMLSIKVELVVVVQNYSKAELRKYITEEIGTSQTKQNH